MPPKRSRNKGKKTKRESKSTSASYNSSMLKSYAVSPSKQEPEKENELHESKASKAVESSEQEDTADSLVPEVGEDTKGTYTEAITSNNSKDGRMS